MDLTASLAMLSPHHCLKLAYSPQNSADSLQKAAMPTAQPVEPVICLPEQASASTAPVALQEPPQHVQIDDEGIPTCSLEKAEDIWAFFESRKDRQKEGFQTLRCKVCL